MTSSRMASSSRPMSSRSSGVRCSRNVVLMGWSPGLLEVDLDGARRGGDARANHLVIGVLDVARAQIAHRAGAQAPDARVADAHATAVRQQRSRLLAGHQQRRRPVRLKLLAAREEADTAAVPADARCGGDGPEALKVQTLGDPCALEAFG